MTRDALIPEQLSWTPPPPRLDRIIWTSHGPTPSCSQSTSSTSSPSSSYLSSTASSLFDADSTQSILSCSVSSTSPPILITRDAPPIEDALYLPQIDACKLWQPIDDRIRLRTSLCGALKVWRRLANDQIHLEAQTTPCAWGRSNSDMIVTFPRIQARILHDELFVAAKALATFPLYHACAICEQQCNSDSIYDHDNVSNSGDSYEGVVHQQSSNVESSVKSNIDRESSHIDERHWNGFAIQLRAFDGRVLPRIICNRCDPPIISSTNDRSCNRDRVDACSLLDGPLYEDLDALLEKRYSFARVESISRRQAMLVSASKSLVHILDMRSFARVNLVAPTWTAGRSDVRVGDEIVLFGDLDHQAFENLNSCLLSLATRVEGYSHIIVVLRRRAYKSADVVDHDMEQNAKDDKILGMIMECQRMDSTNQRMLGIGLELLLA